MSENELYIARELRGMADKIESGQLKIENQSYKIEDFSRKHVDGVLKKRCSVHTLEVICAEYASEHSESESQATYNPGSSMSRWISIKDDRKPEGAALVIDSQGFFFVAHYDIDAGEFRLNYDYFEPEDVTHWMTLPPPPN